MKELREGFTEKMIDMMDKEDNREMNRMMKYEEDVRATKECNKEEMEDLMGKKEYEKYMKERKANESTAEQIGF